MIEDRGSRSEELDQSMPGVVLARERRLSAHRLVLEEQGRYVEAVQSHLRRQRSSSHRCKGREEVDCSCHLERRETYAPQHSYSEEPLMNNDTSLQRTFF